MYLWEIMGGSSVNTVVHVDICKLQLFSEIKIDM